MSRSELQLAFIRVFYDVQAAKAIEATAADVLAMPKESAVILKSGMDQKLLLSWRLHTPI